MALRISDSIRIGPFRVRVSKPIAGKGRTYAGISTRIGRNWIGVSEPVGGKKLRR